jgi:hypothetical protein
MLERFTTRTSTPASLLVEEASQRVITVETVYEEDARYFDSATYCLPGILNV